MGDGSKVSLRGDMVESSNSKATLPPLLEVGVTGEVVRMVGGLAFLDSVGEKLPCDTSFDNLGAGDESMGEASKLGLDTIDGEVLGITGDEVGIIGEVPSIDGDRLSPISGVFPSGSPLLLFFVPKLFLSQFVALPILLPLSSTSCPKPRPSKRSALATDPIRGDSVTIVIVERERGTLSSIGVSGAISTNSSSKRCDGSSASCRLLIRSRRVWSNLTLSISTSWASPSSFRV